MPLSLIVTSYSYDKHLNQRINMPKGRLNHRKQISSCKGIQTALPKRNEMHSPVSWLNLGPKPTRIQWISEKASSSIATLVPVDQASFSRTVVLALYQDLLTLGSTQASFVFFSIPIIFWSPNPVSNAVVGGHMKCQIPMKLGYWLTPLE